MKLHVPFVQLPLRYDAEVLAAEIEALGEQPWRPHPQGYPGNSALTLITVDGDPDNEMVAGPMRATPWLQQCPYLMQVLASLGATWGRTRLMRLSGQAEVTRHVDINYYWREHMRVHVPIVTQPSVRFHCGDADIHMAAGECWIFDTWRQHRVINDAERARIHLVADTVGGDRFLQLLGAGRAPGRSAPGWQARLVEPRLDGREVELDYERFNAPIVMTPWEMREHFAFLVGDALPHPQLPALQGMIHAMCHRWQALWACYGEMQEGWPRYRALVDAFDAALAPFSALALRNQVQLVKAIRTIILSVALADDGSDSGAEIREQASVASKRPSSSDGMGANRPDAIRFDRPVFLLSPPRSGSTLLFETLAQAPGVHTVGGESHGIIEGIEALDTAARGFESNRLLAADATPDVVADLRSRFAKLLRDREQVHPSSASVRLLEKTPKNSLRVPFLTRVFPDAHFVYLYRDPRQVLGSMIDAWESGRFRTYPDLPGWTGPAWSLLLIPDWRSLIGKPLGEIVATQWQTATELLLDDLEQVPDERRTVLRYEALLADPEREIARICTAVGYEWDRPLTAGLPLSRYTLSPPDPEKWRRHAAVIEPQIDRLADTIARAERFLDA